MAKFAAAYSSDELCNSLLHKSRRDIMLRYWTSSSIAKNAFGTRRRSQRMDHTDRPGDVADPWYTGNFEATWRDVLEGCQGLFKELTHDKV